MNKTLINSVIRQVGKEHLEDVVKHGADAGYPGFTYYTDTIAFWKRHKEAIVTLAEEMAQQLGEDMLTMISNFNCIKGDYTPSEIGKALYGRTLNGYETLYNAMAWFALEEVARFKTDN